MPLLSVIIPTHNRPEILQKCIAHLAAQTIVDDIEVIVIDDTHNAKPTFQMEVDYITVPPCHQGAARNIGTKKARASTVLFLGDDMLLTPDACQKHLRVHTHHRPPIAVLGLVDWDPACGVTKTMRWLMRSGWQFGYGKLKEYANVFLPISIQPYFSYTSQISIGKDIALRTPFREDVNLYGWEDIEWGMRIRQMGVRLFFEPKAKALHHHHIELEDSLKRMETLGRSAVEMEKLIKGFDRVPKGLKRIGYEISALLPTMTGKHRAAFLRGIRMANRGKG